MAAHVPILYRSDGSYLIPLTMQRPGSRFVHYEWIPRELLEWEMSEAKAHGGVVEPYISYGYH